MESPSIRLATRDDRSRVVSTTVAAFAEDPAFTWFFPTDYHDQAAAFAGLLFDVRVDEDAIWLADDGAAVAMWNRPRDPGSDRPDRMETGLVGRVAEDARHRILRYEAAVDARLPAAPHWYLGVLATDPAHAGHRLARHAMASGLEAAARDDTPAALETTNERNVVRYEAEGWRVRDRLTVDDELPVWIMVHPGRPRALRR